MKYKRTNEVSPGVGLELSNNCILVKINQSVHKNTGCNETLRIKYKAKASSNLRHIVV